MRAEIDAKVQKADTNGADSLEIGEGVASNSVRRAARRSFANDVGNVSSRRRRDAFFSWLGSGFGSIVLHAGVLFLLFLAIREGTRPDGARGRRTDEIGIVLSDSKNDANAESGTAAASESAATSSGRETSTRRSENVPPETELETPSDLQAVAESLLPPETGIGATIPQTSATKSDGNSNASGAFSPSELGGGGTERGEGQNVGFGDVRGTGRKFVYVLDRSDSMSWRGGAPMNRAISEAIASVESLDPKRGATKFQLVYFNHEPEVFENGRALIDVDLANKAKVVRFLRSISPTGGTAPEKALKVALKMRPDVVFFLTDADEELSEASLAEIQEARRRFRVKQICVVEFGKGTDPKKKTFRRLAGENGGVYVFKDVDAF